MLTVTVSKRGRTLAVQLRERVDARDKYILPFNVTYSSSFSYGCKCYTVGVEFSTTEVIMSDCCLFLCRHICYKHSLRSFSWAPSGRQC